MRGLEPCEKVGNGRGGSRILQIASQKNCCQGADILRFQDVKHSGRALPAMSIFVRTDLMSSAFIFSVRPAHGYGRRLTCFRRRLFCVYAPLIGAADTTTKKNKEKGADILAYYTGKVRKDCRK